MDTNSKNINTEPNVTILVLTYNRAAYIKAAIDSVLAQTYQNFSLVIIDDGSTDDTREMISKYTDHRITYIRHDNNAGLHTRRVESLTHIKGDYAAILDSDDIWTDSTKLATQVAYMEENADCALVGTFITLLSPAGKIIGKDTFATEDADIRGKILIRNQFAHSSVLMRTNSLRRVVGYRDTGLAEDLDLFLQLGVVGSFSNIPQYMTGYRIHNESFNSQKKVMAQSVLTIIRNYKNQYPNYLLAISKAYLRILYQSLRSLL